MVFRCTMRWAVLMAGLCWWLGHPAAAQDPMTVTTDTAEYCIGLADRIAAVGEMPPHARVLWRSGRAMCEHGHVRDGLVRIRRAMMMVRGVAE